MTSTCETCQAAVDHEECYSDDEGQHFCDPCREAEQAYWLGQYRATTLKDRNPERYRREMIDAGREHLLEAEQ